MSSGTSHIYKKKTGSLFNSVKMDNSETNFSSKNYSNTSNITKISTTKKISEQKTTKTNPLDYVEIIGDIDKKYGIVKKIGSGGTSKVYLGFDILKREELFAIKIMKASPSNSESKSFLNEINVLKNLNHKNIVKLIDGGEGILTKDNGKKGIVQFLILELVKYGELFDHVFFPNKGLGEEIGRYVFSQLLNGLDHIHNQGIVHRDMKTENIMLGENWEMKIADFGFATKIKGKKGNGVLLTPLGTASYAAPELLQKKPYEGVPSDIFSLGVSIFILVTGKMPFKNSLMDDPYYKEIIKENYDAYWEKLRNKVPGISKEFKQLFLSMISYDPSERISIKQAINCDWMKDYSPDLKRINKEFSQRAKIVQTKKEYEKKEQEEMTIKTQNNHNSNNNKQYKSGDIELAEDKERHEVEDEDNSDLEDTYNEDENERTSNDLEIKELTINVTNCKFFNTNSNEDLETDSNHSTNSTLTNEKDLNYIINCYDFNPYIIKFPLEDEPGDLMDYIFKSIKNQFENIKILKINDKYKILIKYTALSNNKTTLNEDVDFPENDLEILLEIKRLINDVFDEILIVEFNRLDGEKIDFINLFKKIQSKLN
jgi:serine/threonine protein kinase